MDRVYAIIYKDPTDVLFQQILVALFQRWTRPITNVLLVVGNMRNKHSFLATLPVWLICVPWTQAFRSIRTATKVPLESTVSPSLLEIEQTKGMINNADDDESTARSSFGTKSYWDDVYEGRGDFSADRYSWYYDYNTIKRHLPPLAKKQTTKLLIPGVGNDPLVLDLLQEGYALITLQDYSVAALERQRDMLLEVPSRPDTLRLFAGDVRALPDSWTEQYDVILEKGLLDAVYLSGEGNVEQAVQSLTRVLRPGGLFVSVSGVVPPDVRRHLFGDYQWIRDGSDDLQAGCFVFAKDAS